MPSLRLWFLHHYLVHQEALRLVKVVGFDEDTTFEAVVFHEASAIVAASSNKFMMSVWVVVEASLYAVTK
jgi:hypothetical protein